MWQRFLTYRAGVLAGAYVLLLVVVTLATPYLPGPDPRQISNEVMQAPSFAHLLGTDELGRDVLAGIVHGVEVSLTVGFAAALAATLIGIVIGATAGYYGGIFDLLVMRIAEVFQVVPSFILAAVIVALSGPGLTRVVSVIALLAWPQVARLMRGEVMRIKGLEFVDAVRCLGVRESVILATEVIPNALAPVLAAGTVRKIAVPGNTESHQAL
jgi:peptide/nickel transport system permease protein